MVYFSTRFTSHQVPVITGLHQVRWCHLYVLFYVSISLYFIRAVWKTLERTHAGIWTQNLLPLKGGKMCYRYTTMSLPPADFISTSKIQRNVSWRGTQAGHMLGMLETGVQFLPEAITAELAVGVSPSPGCSTFAAFISSRPPLPFNTVLSLSHKDKTP